MKKIALIIASVLFVCSASFSQSVRVYGNIQNANTDSITFILDNYFIGPKLEVYNFPVKNGSFSGTIKSVQAESVLRVKYKNAIAEIYVEPNDSLGMYFHADSLRNATYKGSAAIHNEFLKQFYSKFSADYTTDVLWNKMKTTPIDMFENFIFTNRKNHNAFLKSYAAKERFSEKFSAYINSTIRFQYYYLLMAHPIINANSNSGLNVGELPPIMLEPFEKLEVNVPSAMISESYRNFIYFYVVYFTSKSNGYKKFSDYSVSMEKKFYCAQQRLKGKPYHWFLSKYLFEDEMRSAPSIVKKLYTALEADEKKGVYSAIAKEKVGGYMNSKDPVKGAATSEAQFKLTDMNGKNVSINDFKGKAIYVDFWASWCGPCRQQFPFSHALKDKFTEKQKKQIVFLYISIDADENAWRNAVAQNKLEGVNAISPGNWSSEAIKYFRINGIPRYMLIDKEGNIADPNAKRPSDPNIVNDILQLIEP